MSTQYKEEDHVQLVRDRVGTIKFIGPVHFAEGHWFGIELDEGYPGKNNGTFRGVRYFKCPEKQGLFIQEKKIVRRLDAHEKSTRSRSEPETKIGPQTRLEKGDNVTLMDGRTGVVAFIGRVKFARGEWIGLILDSGHPGKNDGSMKGHRYFKCPQGQGLFVTRKRLKSKSLQKGPRTKNNNASSTSRASSSRSRSSDRRGTNTTSRSSTSKKSSNQSTSNNNNNNSASAGGVASGSNSPKSKSSPSSSSVQNSPSKTTSETNNKKNKDNKNSNISSPARTRKKRASRNNSSGSRLASSAKGGNNSKRSTRTKRSVRTNSRNKTPEQIADPASSTSGRRSRNNSSRNSLKIPEKLKQFPLLDEPFFHGKLNRHDSEDLLKKKGDWLLRLDRRKMTASVRKSKSQVDHVEIAYEEKKKKPIYSFRKNGRKTVTYRSFDELMKSGLGGRRSIMKPGQEPIEEPKRVPEPAKPTPKRVPEKQPPTDEPVNKKEPAHGAPQPEDEDSDDFILAIKADQDVKPSVVKPPPDDDYFEEFEEKIEEEEDSSEDLAAMSINALLSGREPEPDMERPSEEVTFDDSPHSASVSELFSDEPSPTAPKSEASPVNPSDTWGVEADASTKQDTTIIDIASPSRTDDSGNDSYDDTPPQRPRKRSADLSAEKAAEKAEKPKKPESKRTAERQKSQEKRSEASAEPAWLAKIPSQKQNKLASDYTRVLQRATDSQTQTISARDVVQGMEKHGLSESQTRELHKFITGEELPMIEYKQEAPVDVEGERNDVLGQSMKTETRLTEDEENVVAGVFSALSLDGPGLELVVFHTFIQHFQVPLSDEEVNTLFPYIDTEMQGYVSSRRYLSFLREEMSFVPDVEQNRVLMIASIKDNIANGAVVPSQQQEEKTMAPAVRGWLDGAVATLSASENGDIPPKRPEPKLEQPVIEVPGGYTKADLLEEWEDLYNIQNVSETREALVKGLQKCCVPCDFNSDSPKEKMYIKQKQQILVNISQYVSETKKWFNEAVLIAIRDLIKYNLFRTLPFTKPFVLHDPDDDPKLDPAWEHLHPCYEILLRLVIAPFTKDKMVRRHLENSFLENLVNMFMSEDPRERDYLKVILHRFYGKFLKPRPHIRKTMHEMLFNFIYKNPFLPGVCEILEILGSIINGFSIPLKDEHKEFLNYVLIPLHKAPLLMDFSAQLNYCITQFVAKDPHLTPQILEGLLRYWPLQSSQKEVLFLTEIEAILDIVEPEAFDPVVEKIFDQLGQCMCSVHFQVAEQALNLTANETISYYITGQRARIVPVLYPYLQKNLRHHWHDTVRSVTVNILATLREMDTPLYKKIVLETKQQRKREEDNAATRKVQWNLLLKNHKK